MAETKKNIMTFAGLRALEDELFDLKVYKRKEVAQKIKEAREQGDLSENAEYDAAREEQGLVETRIAEIEDILQNASIIQATAGSTVGLGSRVELKTGDKTVVYSLVGPVEADPLSGKISNESPIGLQLMGKSVGDQVTISTPKGDTTYEIVSLA